MKRLISLILCCVMLFALCACNTTNSNPVASPEPGPAPVSEQPLKVGFIYLHDENSTYDLNFLKAAKEACLITGSEIINKTGIPEGNECYEAACELADMGCSLVFADSFGHEDYLIQAARDYPEVQFCHATGTKAHTVYLPNFHNAFAAIYEGRFIGGAIAGMKLNEMISEGKITPEEAKVGYIGAYPYAEVKSGYTAFFLGVRYTCPEAFMEVTFTNSWYDPTLEKEAAIKLINDGCVLISEHADSMGAPTECEANKIPFVFYNGSCADSCPNSYMIGSRINWTPYFTYIINCVKNGESIDTDWVGDFNTGSIVITEINDNVAPAGTWEQVAVITQKFKNETLNVFDTAAWTVNDDHLNAYMADVDTDDNYTPDTNVIENGVFYESLYRSAPYFDIDIDGITILGN